MSSKVKAAAAKKTPSKSPAPAKAAGKGPAKAGVLAAGAKGAPAPGAELPAVDPDEAEEQEDAARASSTGGGGDAAALAAAGGNTEMSASFKNFRHHPDMENFYRFIYENDLRHEALQIIDIIQNEKQLRRQMKGLKANPH